MLDARPAVIRPQSHGQWDVLAGVRFLLAWIVACDLSLTTADKDNFRLLRQAIRVKRQSDRLKEDFLQAVTSGLAA